MGGEINSAMRKCVLLTLIFSTAVNLMAQPVEEEQGATNHSPISSIRVDQTRPSSQISGEADNSKVAFNKTDRDFFQTKTKVKIYRGGGYVSMEVGYHRTSKINTSGDTPLARGSICDRFLNPFPDIRPSFCDDSQSEGTSWINSFDTTGGFFGGVAFGYRYDDGELKGLRAEVEYFYRESVYNEALPIKNSSGVTQAKLGGEVEQADDRIGSITSSNLYGNVYFDLHNSGWLTPYIGLGAGIGFNNVDYGLLWLRNLNPNEITSVEEYFPFNRQDDLKIVQQNLAGTASSLQDEFRDVLFGFQVLLGVDFALSQDASIGFKFRHVRQGNFESQETKLDRLRSHEPSNNPDGSDPLLLTFKANPIDLSGISINLKYYF